MIGTYGGSTWENGRFNRYDFLIWFSSWCMCWSFYWYDSWLAQSEVLLERFIVQIYLLVISILTIVHLLGQILGWKVLYFLVNDSNIVRHELLHLWKTFLACWILVGGLYRVWDSFHSFFCDICLMSYVVFCGWYDVQARFCMWCPWCSTVWPIVDY